MPVTLETLQIEFKAKMNSLHSELNGVKQQLNGITTSTGRASNGMRTLANSAKLFVTGIAARAMYNVGKASLSMANDVVESENLFSVAMKDMASDARAWSEELSESLGLNAFELRKNVGTFNTMFKSMGLGTQEAYGMATGLTELANDMASFYNLSTEEAFDKLRAGITGETEPLKRLGILVDETTTKTYAYAKGIAKQGKELSQTEKLQARYQAILAQTATAQGDLARTIDGPVNQIRALNSMLDQAKIALGQAFQPIQAMALPILKDFAAKLKFVAQAFGTFMKQLTGYSGVNALAALSAGKSAQKQADLSDALNETAKSLKKSGGAAKQAAKDGKVGLKAFDEINKLADETTNAGGGGKLDEIDVPELNEATEYGNALEVISTQVQAAADAIREFWDGIQNSAAADVVRGVGDGLKWIWENGIKPIGEWMLKHPDTVANGLLAIGAAVTVWNVGLNYEVWLTGIATGLKAIGAAIAAHPVLFTVSVVAGGLVLLASSIKQANDEAKEADLASRFGDIALSMEELKTITSSVTTPFYDASQNLKKEFQAIADAASTVKSLAMESSKIIFAYSLQPEPMTADEAKSLKERVQGEIDAGMKLLNDASVTAAYAINVTFGDTAEGAEAALINQDNWQSVKDKAATLGAELQAAISAALLDDTITPEEQAGIEAYRQKLINLLMQATNQDVISAKIKMAELTLEFGKASLTSESVKGLSDGLQAQLATLYSANKEMISIELEGQITLADAAEASDEEVQRIVELYQSKLEQQNLEARMTVGRVYFNSVVKQITTAFGKELDASQKAINLLSKDWITEAAKYIYGDNWEQALRDAETDSNVSSTISNVAGEMFKEAMENIDMPDEAAQQNIKKLLEMMQPTIAEWQTLYNSLLASGAEIPEWLSKGLSNAEALQMVIDASADIYKAANSDFSGLAVKYGNYATNAVSSFASNLNASNALSKIAEAARSVANKAISVVKSILGINSPSKVFRDLAGFTGEGYVLGLKDMIPQVSAISEKLAGAVYDPMGGINTDLLNPGRYSVSTEAVQRMQVGYEDQADIMGGYVQQAVSEAVAQVVDRLQIRLDVDGETWATGTAKTINDSTRRTGKLLLEF